MAVENIQPIVIENSIPTKPSKSYQISNLVTNAVKKVDQVVNYVTEVVIGRPRPTFESREDFVVEDGVINDYDAMPNISEGEYMEAIERDPIESSVINKNHFYQPVIHLHEKQITELDELEEEDEELDSKIHCCGHYPQRYPFKTHHNTRDCCYTHTFNVMMYDCCLDGKTRTVC